MKKFLICFLLTILNVVHINAQKKIEFFDPYHLKKGMKGYALTVFQGIEPEKMDVEVIAFMPNRLAKAGMVLVKLSGENVERTRVAAGMSGSPVYIDDKLVGALAYTWANARELLAGVVPIQDMISDKQRSDNTIYPPMGATPIQTAWVMDGMNNTDLITAIQNISQEDTYQRGLEEFITVPSSRSNGIAPLKPGDAVAIKLVEGDLNFASIGTVTHVDGEDVYIYGHPMDSEGPISLPLAKAEIFDIMASTQLSFKIGQALPDTIGSTMFDGMSAVYGRFDKQAVMVPVVLNVYSDQYTNTYKMNMARSRKYLPTLISKGIATILERELGKNIERQINVSWKIQFTNNQVVTNNVTWVRDTVYDPSSISDYWENYISVVWKNGLVHLVPSDITFDIKIDNKRYDYYVVSSVKTQKKEYFSGDLVDIALNLNQYSTKEKYTNITLKIPENIKQGQYTLIVGSSLAIEFELARLFPDKYRIRSEQQLFEELRRNINTHVLQAVLVDTRVGSILGNNFFGNVPQSRRSWFESKYGTGEYILSPKLFKNTIYMDLPVIGGDVKLLNIVVPDPKSVIQ